MLNHVLFFLLNGAGTLLLETAWLKKHLSIFGTSPETYGSILLVYFVGVSAGSWYFRDRKPASAVGFYAGFAASLFFSLGLPILLDGLVLPVEFVYGHAAAYKTLVWLFAFISIFPACFFLGSFFPLVSGTVDRGMFVFLYGVQTLGTALGVLFGSFYLPYAVGYLFTFLIGIGINIVSLFFLNRLLGAHRGAAPEAAPRAAEAAGISFGLLAFLSGFLSLLLQVLWVRFTSLATDNSIYAFGSASLLVLLLLTIASALTSRFPAEWFRTQKALPLLLTLSLAGIVLSTELYLRMTDGLAIKAITSATGLFSSLAFAAPFICAGYFFPSFIFPFILRMARQGGSVSAGVGRLIALNGIGCALGSGLASFVLLPHLGMWMTLLIGLVGYGLFLFFAATGWVRFAAPALTGALLFAFNPLAHPLVTPVDPYTPGGQGALVWAKEGKYGVVSVIDYRNRFTLWLNNTYQLEAGMEDIRGPYRMGLLPTVLHPSAKKLAMVGVGTGISASAFLNSGLESVTLVEMIPEVVEAASIQFRAYNENVLADPRVRTAIGDGRHYLKTATQGFDIISSDLFTPWNEGTAYLYTVDHFRNVKKRLNPDGMFCLWLPLFQLTREEFLIIAKSFVSVFPHTTAWQVSWGVETPAVALVGADRISTQAIRAYMTGAGSRAPRPDLIQLHESGVFCNYVGPVVPDDTWKGIPLNTLDFPVIEFRAAQTGRQLVTGKNLLDLFDVFYRLPGNPGGEYFTSYDDRLESYRRAGRDLNLFTYYQAAGDQERAAYYAKQASFLPVLGIYRKVLASGMAR